MVSAEKLREYLVAYALIFTFLFVTHLPLLRLPYFWDETGYFIPAARDLLLTGSPASGSLRWDARRTQHIVAQASTLLL